MSLRRVLIVAVCGLCVWGFARSETGPDARETDARVTGGGGDNYDEAAARYRSNQCRHWRQLATGATASAH